MVRLIYSEKRKELFSAGLDNYVRVWDPETMQEKFNLLGHINDVWSIAFDESHEHVISGSYDKSIKVWNLKEKIE